MKRGNAIERLERLFFWGIDLRLWVSFCVSGLTFFCQRVLIDASSTRGTVYLAPSITFFATLCLYNLDGLADGRCLGITKSYHRFITVGAGACALGLGAWASIDLLIWVIFGMLISGLYAAPLGFAKQATQKANGIKTIQGVKAPFVGFCVGIAVVSVPYIIAQAGAKPFKLSEYLKTWSKGQIELNSNLEQAALLALIVSLLCCQNALLCDVPDEVEDRANGTPTLLIAFGPRLHSALGVLLCLSSWSVTQVFLMDVAAKAGCTLLSLTLLVFTVLLSGRLGRRTMTFVVDGSLLLPLFISFN